MASASDFLKKRAAARQQAESIQSSDKTPLGKNDDGTVTRASNFLRNKAQNAGPSSTSSTARMPTAAAADTRRTRPRASIPGWRA